MSDSLPSDQQALRFPGLIASSLITTDRGLIRIGGLGNKHHDSGQAVNFQIAENGSQAEQFFFHEDPVVRIKTRNGYEVTASSETKIQIIDNNELISVKITSIQPGMRLRLVMNLIGEARDILLPDYPAAHGQMISRQNVVVPQQMTPELAELIGLYYSCQGNLLGSLNFIVDKNTQLIGKISDKIKQVFSVDPSIDYVDGSVKISVPGNLASSWWTYLSFSSKRITPAKIRRTNNPETYKSFLRGLFSGKQTEPVVRTVNKEMANDWRTIMLAVGIPSCTVLEDQFGYPEYEIRISPHAAQALLDKDQPAQLAFSLEAQPLIEEIVSLKPAGKETVYSLKTDDSNYIANGIAISSVTQSKN